MWKYIPEGIAGVIPDRLTALPVANWPWRKILADGAILLALLLTSSLLVRG